MIFQDANGKRELLLWLLDLLIMVGLLKNYLLSSRLAANRTQQGDYRFFESGKYLLFLK